jgi:hypothetical protein
VAAHQISPSAIAITVLQIPQWALHTGRRLERRAMVPGTIRLAFSSITPIAVAVKMQIYERYVCCAVNRSIMEHDSSNKPRLQQL